MSDAKKKNGLDKFLTVKTLLSKCCAEVMRTLVIETAKRNEPPKDHTGHWSLDRFLRQYKNRIERRIHTIDKLGRPMDILFPRKGKTKLDEWDESLLSFILLNVCFLDENMADNVADIRKVRNETSHSSKALNMTDSQYESYLERLKRSIKACLDFIDNRDLSSFINAQVSEIEFDEVDENEKMRRLQSIYQKDREDQEKLKNASEVYERMENELSEIVKKFKGTEMPEHQLELVFKNSSQELEKKLSKCIVEKINELVKSKKRLHSSSENDDDIEMTIAVANLLEKWKSKGWVITEAIKGSVLLNVRCSTFDDVCYMYNTHKGEGSNMHVSDLQTALQEVIGLDVKLSLVMHDCEMETFMEKIVSSLLSRSKALTSLNTNGDRNDTKVRLYMKRCLPNVPTLTDVDLKELDGHLRRIAEVLEKKNDLPSVSLHVCEEEMQSEVKADLQIGESMQMTGQLNPILDRLDLEMDSLDSNKQTMEMETGWPHGLIEEKEKMETVQDLSEEPEPHTTRYEHLDLYEKMFGMEFTSNNIKKFEMKSDKTDGQADVPDVAKGHECRTISNSHCSSSSETESTYNSSAEERGGLMNKPDRNWFRVRRAWKYRYLKEGLKGPADDIVQKMHDSRTMEQSVEERFDRITSILEDDKELKVRLDTQQAARSVKMRNIDIEGQTGKLDSMCHHREEEKEYLIRKQDKDPEEYLRNHNSIETIIDSWKSTPLSGKSSIINAIRSQGKTQAATAPISSTVDTSYIMETEMNSEQGLGEGTRPELQVKLVKDYIRFRYMSKKYPNKRGAKPKHSEVDDNDKDCLAEVMIKNYNGAAKIIAYCVDEKRMLLPYNLFGDLCHSGVYVCRYKFRPEKAPLRLQKVSVTTPIAKEYKDNLKNQLAILSEAGIHDIKFNDLVEDKQIGFVMFKAILDDGDGEILSQISTPFQNKIDTNIRKDCCDESVYAFDSEECCEKTSDCPLPEWGECKLSLYFIVGLN
ncbi:uncharacterized protein LOC128552115 isoform X2 [Mercenaria mercenaria]|uniref:uncharacterized protein LOC128552115 isoform X2 n=1 Tax=Mercenaria mercenaria TaxID=6596 RepID=UPI00234E631D|nr:uncharacterized protein LOC128552115 isoform X2 [Mercenaria mercenaria]